MATTDCQGRSFFAPIAGPLRDTSTGIAGILRENHVARRKGDDGQRRSSGGEGDNKESVGGSQTSS